MYKHTAQHSRARQRRRGIKITTQSSSTPTMYCTLWSTRLHCLKVTQENTTTKPKKHLKKTQSISCPFILLCVPSTTSTQVPYYCMQSNESPSNSTQICRWDYTALLKLNPQAQMLFLFFPLHLRDSARAVGETLLEQLFSCRYMNTL